MDIQKFVEEIEKEVAFEKESSRKYLERNAALPTYETQYEKWVEMGCPQHTEPDRDPADV